MYRRDELPWQGDSLLNFSGTEVELCLPPELYERQSSKGRFVLGKSRGMVEEMMRIIGDREIRSIVDLGVYKGGSVVLYNEVFQPWRLMAVDLNPTPPPALIDYLETRNPPAGVRLKLGVNQAYRPGLKMLVDRTFQGAALDLVVDDASHLYFETRESFRTLFPLLRPGGLYIIEDWGWAHWRGEYWQENRGGSYFSAQPPLTNLLIEIMLLSASRPGFVSKMVVNSAVAYVERGPDRIEGDFELSEHYLNRGEPIPLFGAAGAGGGITHG
jgi:hypothetical protein